MSQDSICAWVSALPKHTPQGCFVKSIAVRGETRLDEAVRGTRRNAKAGRKERTSVGDLLGERPLIEYPANASAFHRAAQCAGHTLAIL